MEFKSGEYAGQSIIGILLDLKSQVHNELHANEHYLALKGNCALYKG